jgi:clan AA aspartic protease (TIGR02281 family)
MGIRRLLVRSLLIALCGGAVGSAGPAAFAETIQLEQDHGIYLLPVQINGQLTIPFILDTGASAVAIPADVFKVLKRTGTVKDSDFLGPGTVVLADGSKQSSQRFILHALKVGGQTIHDVVANVVPMEGDPLLGQSFLSKLPSWTIDNQQHALVLHDGANAPQVTSTAPVPRPDKPAIAPHPEPLSTVELQSHCTNAIDAKSYDDAVRWCRIAANGGDAVSMSNFGKLCQNGWGVPQNYAEAMRWYRMAADKGDATAMSKMGTFYRQGLGVPQNIAEAIRWYRKAAERGSAEAEFLMGLLYMDGQGVPRNYAEALRWYRLAADKGEARALNNVGWLVAQGFGVSKDCGVAKGWFERAAAAGSQAAQDFLGNGARGACQW